jgi:hypothetical protein
MTVSSIAYIQALYTTGTVWLLAYMQALQTIGLVLQ